jgi:hypothetical protein
MTEQRLGLTYKEAAAMFGMDKRVIINACNRNDLARFYPAPRSPRIKPTELQRWVDTLPTESP